jgi:hypothetical protein
MFQPAEKLLEQACTVWLHALIFKASRFSASFFAPAIAFGEYLIFCG